VTVTEIISQVLSYTDNIPPTDADYNDRRLRLLNFLREVVANVWYEREWPFSRRTVTVSVLVDPLNYAILPDDFLGLGDYGTVVLAEQFHDDPLENVPEHQIVLSRQTSLRTTTPGICSVFGQEPTTLAHLLQVPPTDTSFDLIVNYLKDVPTLDEAANNTKLAEIPTKYHQRVLVPGLQSRTLQSKGDSAWNTYEGRFVEALNEMKSKERRRQGTIWQFPSFFGNRRHGRYA
jgi:hypothetical protein